MENKGKFQVVTDYGVHFYNFDELNILHIFYNSDDNTFLINQIENNKENTSLIMDEGEEDYQVFEIDNKTFNDALFDALISFKIENYL